MKEKILFLIIIGFCILLLSCYRSEISTGVPSHTNIDIFKQTAAYELAKAVKWQNTIKIHRLCKQSPSLMYILDPYYQYTVLHWAVGMEKYRSVKALLKAGMDPNVMARGWNLTPLFLASRYSFIDIFAKNGTKYVEILLEYGADANIAVENVQLPNLVLADGTETPRFGPYDNGETPLMRSITMLGKNKSAKAKILVEKGNADINATTVQGMSAAARALNLKAIEVAHYLITEHNAIVSEPYYIGSAQIDVLLNNAGKPLNLHYPVTSLRKMIYDLDSKEYKMKLEIIKEFARQGVDYTLEPISESTLSSIKKRYPDTWEEYIKVY